MFVSELSITDPDSGAMAGRRPPAELWGKRHEVDLQGLHRSERHDRARSRWSVMGCGYRRLRATTAHRDDDRSSAVVVADADGVHSRPDADRDLHADPVAYADPVHSGADTDADLTTPTPTPTPTPDANADTDTDTDRAGRSRSRRCSRPSRRRRRVTRQGRSTSRTPSRTSSVTVSPTYTGPGVYDADHHGGERCDVLGRHHREDPDDHRRGRAAARSPPTPLRRASTDLDADADPTRRRPDD